MGNGKGRKPRPWRWLREGTARAKIFLRNPERGEKDGHIGAHQGGDKRVLTCKSGSREWGMGSGEEKTEEVSTQRNQRRAEGKRRGNSKGAKVAKRGPSTKESEEVGGKRCSTQRHRGAEKKLNAEDAENAEERMREEERRGEERSDCLAGQAISREFLHGVRVLSMALRVTRSLRMQATSASFLAFPAARSLV